MVGFREVSPDEAAAHELLVEYFEARDAGFPPAMGAYRTVFPDPVQFRGENGVFIVMEDVDVAGDPADVGCGGVRLVMLRDDGVVRFELKHLFLQPHLRGRGFGHVLLAELERRAAGFGATELILDTNASLEAAAGLYRSNGYREIAPYNDNPNATHWYCKEII